MKMNMSISSEPDKTRSDLYDDNSLNATELVSIYRPGYE